MNQVRRPDRSGYWEHVILTPSEFFQGFDQFCCRENLRNEIDKLRKERFFFENIYKKLEKELEKLRKDISKNLEEAYDNYEQRDVNQEGFENLKAQMIKKETEYTNILSGIANEMNIRNTRKKAQEKKELKSFKIDEENTLATKKYSRKLKCLN